MTPSRDFQDALRARILFVGGKGGVGKTSVSQALALHFAKKRERTLWVTIEDPLRPRGDTVAVESHLWMVNSDPVRAFEEYAVTKIKIKSIARLFIRNQVMNYIAHAAPGIPELVLLGKIWHERLNYQRVIVDMPSTGYGIAMFKATFNFARLFTSGPAKRDAEEVLQTFSLPHEAAHLIVSLPEEMPLAESLELDHLWSELFPNNHSCFLVNRKFPTSGRVDLQADPDSWDHLIARSGVDYLEKRLVLEHRNLDLWRSREIRFSTLEYVPVPKPSAGWAEMRARVSDTGRGKDQQEAELKEFCRPAQRPILSAIRDQIENLEKESSHATR